MTSSGRRSRPGKRRGSCPKKSSRRSRPSGGPSNFVVEGLGLRRWGDAQLVVEQVAALLVRADGLPAIAIGGEQAHEAPVARLAIRLEPHPPAGVREREDGLLVWRHRLRAAIE